MGVRIQDDLYNAINGEWIEKAVIPSDLPLTGGFMDLDVNVEKIMIQELENLKKEGVSDENLKNALELHKKFFDEEKRSKGKEQLLENIKILDEIKTLDDLKNNLYTLHSHHITLPFEIGVTTDMKDAKHHCLVVSSLRTILPDPSMYGTPQEEMLIGLFSQVATGVLKTLGIDDETILPKALAFDKKLSKVVKTSEEWADYIACYNPISFEEAEKKIDLNFKDFIIKLFGKTPDKVVVMDPKYIDNLNELIQTSLDEFVEYTKLDYLIATSQYISEELRNISSSFRRALMGVSEMTSLEKWAYQTVDRHFGEVLGVYYGRKYFGEEAKKDVINLVKNLILSYKERLEKNTWLTKDTAKKAILKLDTMEIKIGYPDKVRDIFSKLKVNEEDSLYKAIFNVSGISLRDGLSKLFKDVDRSEWVMSGNTVNACYNPTSNDITFPAAILQAPFYSLKQKIEENYGGIGCVIGHEISHAFDNNGAQMDEFGNINQWWTKEDYDAFKVKTQLMIDEFDGLPLLDAKVNGTLTVSENIADNGGITSSLMSLKRVKENPDLSLFFINYAKIWCQKAKEEYTKLLLTVDVHGPAYYRVNMQVRNFDEFFKAFSVTKDDKMWLDEDKRVVIW